MRFITAGQLDSYPLITGPRMTSSGDLKNGNGCNGVENGGGGGGVMTRSKTLPVLVQQQVCHPKLMILYPFLSILTYFPSISGQGELHQQDVPGS